MFTFRSQVRPERVVLVVSNVPSSGHRLSELARVQPADRTLQNLLSALTAQLDMCSRLPVYEYEAASEGHEASAVAFHEVCEVERRSFHNLLTCLRLHLDEVERAAGQPRRDVQ
jgi:hypothetical protein